EDLVRLPPPDVSVENGSLRSEVARVDWFGNVQLAATGEELAISSLHGHVVVNGMKALVAEKFADVPDGELIVYVNSAGHVAVARNGGNANEVLGSPSGVTIALRDRPERIV